MTGTALVEKFDFGSVTNFDPSVFKEELAKVDAIKELAIKLKDRTMLQTAAAFRAAKTAQAVKYYKGVVRSPDEGRPNKFRSSAELLAPEIAKELGFSQDTIDRWVKGVWPTWPEGEIDREKYATALLTAWMTRAGMLEAVGGGGGGGGITLEKVWRDVEKLPDPDEIEVRDRLIAKYPITTIVNAEKTKNNKALPKPNYVEDDFIGIVEKPADYRVTKAVHAFFNDVPGNKRVWVQQRMEEQPSTMKGSGVHVEWIEAFWDSDPEVQSAIREEIKIENMRRMEG